MKHEKSLNAYLQESEYINYSNIQIQDLIRSFKQDTEMERIRAVFEYVRDEIDHSYDVKKQEVTRRASEVLEKRHGICYAKSHLLAAILRGMDIPAGICYQRLTLFDKPEDGYCIHALNSVYLKDLGKWVRIDARGNKEGINAQFSIEEEQLAFPIRVEYGEKDYATNYDEPHPDIIKTLEENNDCIQMYQKGLPEELSD
ncbi:transglutaminase-like domain-containing protein [Paenibacillus lautus]|jgi:transglutaminase-like putative cysteine protease|uniref:Transglutaminase family protein n=1 Tax=Paenibacillus lautus TaxID=1401 RepID=A0A385TEY8_PAELA|nr:transglutaminase-like domain-containing protein [Paenibacillus lautus]AYB43140.1 transglutaminase family protein [Paenibacillus lautus]MCI1774312.1 transglutaminase-like domain-containing protein [Paenibacillus lautus]